MKRLIPLSVLLVVFLAACEGPVGPEGPAGPSGAVGAVGAVGAQGPAGQDGEDGTGASVLSLSGTLDSDGAGGVVIRNASLEDVVVNCWTSEDGEVWLLVAYDTNPNFDSVICGAVEQGNDVTVAIVNGIPGWFWLIVAIVEE